MGYTIQYEPDKNRKYPIRTSPKKPGKVFIIAGCGAVVLFAALALEPLRNWLLPGDPQVTGAAFSEMVDSLRAGEGLYEAVSVFCQEVLVNADAY